MPQDTLARAENLVRLAQSILMDSDPEKHAKADSELKSLKAESREIADRVKQMLKTKLPDDWEPIHGIWRFNEPTMVRVKGCILAHTRTEHVFESERFETEFRLYEAERGEGNLPIYIFDYENEGLFVGEASLFLRLVRHEKDLIEPFAKYRLTELERPSLLAIAKKIGVKIEKDDLATLDVEGLASAISGRNKEMHHQLFYELTGALPEGEIHWLVDFDGLIEEFLRDGCQKDDDIVYLARAQIPIVDTKEIEPLQCMKHSPHGMELTHTKCSKTTTADKIGVIYQKPSTAGLIGFADSQKSNPGKVNEETMPVFIDEISEELETKEAAVQLLSFMEQGEVKIARGMGVAARGYCSLTWLANPRNREANVGEFEDGEAVYEILSSLLGKITQQERAFGSRMGFFLFKPDAEPTQGEGFPLSRSRRYKAIIHQIRRQVRTPFSRCLKEESVRKWLSRPFDEQFLTELDKFIRAIPDYAVREFLTGLKESHRHARGTALREAFLDHGLEIVKGGVIDESMLESILAKAELHLTRIQQIAIVSCNELKEILSKKAVLRKTLLSKLMALRPDYLRYFVQSVIIWREQIGHDPEGEVLEALNTAFLEIMDRKGTYNSLDKVLEPITKDIANANSVLHIFGIDIRAVDLPSKLEHVVRISDAEIFSVLCEVYRENQAQKPQEPQQPEGRMAYDVEVSDEIEVAYTELEKQQLTHKTFELHAKRDGTLLEEVLDDLLPFEWRTDFQRWSAKGIVNRLQLKDGSIRWQFVGAK